MERDTPHQHSERALLILTLVLEGILALVFVVWAHARNFHQLEIPTGEELLSAVLYFIPLATLNVLCFQSSTKNHPWFRSFHEFLDDVIQPIIKVLSLEGIIFISICAGIGEELFFRGVLQNEFGIFVSSALFALLHLGTFIRRFWAVGVVYFIMSLYLGFVYAQTESLNTVIIQHIIYDIFAFLWLRRQIQQKIS